jgi:hypothetical protein
MVINIESVPPDSVAETTLGTIVPNCNTQIFALFQNS